MLNRDTEQSLGVLQLSVYFTGKAAVSSSQPVSIKAEPSGVASPSPQPGTSGACKAENKELVAGSVPPCPGKAAVSSSQPVTSQPVSIKAEPPDVARPSPQPGTSGACKAENKEVVAGSVPPCPGKAAVSSSQPVSIKAKPSGVASPSPQPGTSGACKAENKELVAGSVPPCPGKAAVSSSQPVTSQPVSIKAEPSGVARSSPQPGTSGPCKAENKDVEQELVVRIPLSLVCLPGEAAVSSQPVSIKAETSGVARPSPQPGTSEPSKAQNRDVEQELVLGSAPPSPGLKTKRSIIPL
ncbi:UNVERIFIED_CONTAM: hypothetical protein K2H54_004534 [Gekko kuhli]